MTYALLAVVPTGNIVFAAQIQDSDIADLLH